MMDVYQKHSVLYNKNPNASLRSSSNSLNYPKSKFSQNSGGDIKTSRRTMMGKHK